MRIQYCYDVEIVFLIFESNMEVLVMSVHQDFEMPEFFMPELLIKELCSGVGRGRAVWPISMEATKNVSKRTQLHENVFLDSNNCANKKI